MRAITLIRPMPAAIVHGTKRIENRPVHLPKAMRGVPTVVAVHAGKKWSGDYVHTVRDIDGVLHGDSNVLGGTRYERHMEDEGIVGLMRLTGRVYTHADPPVAKPPHDFTVMICGTLDPWFSGPYGYEIDTAVAFPEPIPCLGLLGWWPVPEDVVAQMRERAQQDPVNSDLRTLFYQWVGE